MPLVAIHVDKQRVELEPRDVEVVYRAKPMLGTKFALKDNGSVGYYIFGMNDEYHLYFVIEDFEKDHRPFFSSFTLNSPEVERMEEITS